MMHIDKNKRICLNSAYFDAMRRELDFYIRRILKVMETKDTDEGVITLKIDFEVIQAIVSCDAAQLGQRESKKLNIDYKISMTMQSKTERKGEAVGSGHEVIQSGDDYYILTEDEANGQINMFDGDFAAEEADEQDS